MSAVIPQDQFQRMVELMPLVSIDLVIINHKKEVLLGLRNNRPAKGYWFVPGGRILKDELITVALNRIAFKELNIDTFEINGFLPRFLGVYEHLYSDAFVGDVGISTHYVVLGFELLAPERFELTQHDEQHTALEWWPMDMLLASDEVHQNTKNYFLNKELK